MPRLTRILLLAVLLAACGRGPGLPAPTAPAATATVPLAAPNPTQVMGVPISAPTTLEIWLPAEFADPASPGGHLLNARLAAYESDRRGTRVHLRVKAAGGPGGLLSALQTASAAAPGVLPNLVALRRDDLALAAAAGLVLPLDDRLAPESLAGYYPFAQEMGRHNNAWFGLPFAADARILVYPTSAYPTPPLTFSQLVTGSLALPGGESSGLTLLNLYLGLGGGLQNEAGELALDPAVLARTLSFLQSLQTAGVLAAATIEQSDPAATWQLFRDRRASLAVTSAQWYMLEYDRVEGSAASLLPTAGEAQVALLDGWSWAVVNARPERLEQSFDLLNWLTDPAWQATWTEAAPVLPTRAATLAGWTSRRMVPLASDVLTHAQLQPSAASLAVLGPPLRQALADVLLGRASPLAAATTAATTVNPP